ncbi:MAG TPA: bacteriohemerythrin [Syntrophorhabdaceae bacterium]|nr:bacteriohemerythrin [Syntrophorhabdaceae bacterium]
MALLEWNEKLRVDIREIDEQHKRLVDLINRLHDAMKTGQGKAVLGGTLTELFDYTDYHFGTEEKYFRQYQYPSLVVHKSAHDLFRSRVAELKAKAVEIDSMVTIETMNFLKDWLYDHILGSDQKYAPFLKTKGLA